MTLLGFYFDDTTDINYMVADRDGNIITTDYAGEELDDYDNAEILEKKTAEELHLNRMGWVKVDAKAEPLSVIDTFQMLIPTKKDIAVPGSEPEPWYYGENLTFLEENRDDGEDVCIRYHEDEQYFELLRWSDIYEEE